MSKRTKKQKKKQQADQALNPPSDIQCFDCDWKGKANEIHFNGKDDRMECPNCQSTKFGVDCGENYISPVTKSIDYSNRVVGEWVDGYCNDCKWRGADYALKVDPKTAKDMCPECGSEKIDFIDYKAPSPDGTPAFVPSSAWGSNHSYSQSHIPCYKSHPALSLTEGLVIYGGSCLNPVETNCDVYIGFDNGMNTTVRALPWTKGWEVRFKITDGSVPTDKKNFKKLVEWTAEQLEEGKKVHAGCIGGHGRTGLFFAALVAHMGVSDDPIKYVRENYCDRAVENKKQVKFLMDNYSSLDAKGSKEAGGTPVKDSKPEDDGFNWLGTTKIW